jgi:hypothetical protein
LSSFLLEGSFSCCWSFCWSKMEDASCGLIGIFFFLPSDWLKVLCSFFSGLVESLFCWVPSSAEALSV